MLCLQPPVTTTTIFSSFPLTTINQGDYEECSGAT